MWYLREKAADVSSRSYCWLTICDSQAFSPSGSCEPLSLGCCGQVRRAGALHCFEAERLVLGHEESEVVLLDVSPLVEDGLSVLLRKGVEEDPEREGVAAAEVCMLELVFREAELGADRSGRGRRDSYN